MKSIFDWKKYEAVSRAAVGEGVVLLKNDNNTLPFKAGETISVFGRIQLDYYSSGAGSGGMVNTPYVVSIPDGLRNSGVVKLNEKLFNIYREWEREHPFEKGVGWANEPYCQEEMPVTFEMCKSAREISDAAIVVIGRCQGEDKDSVRGRGSYQLTEDEEKLLYTVSNTFERTVVLLNVGGIIDMKWVLKYNPAAVMYVWQGGAEGGNGIADVLCGIVNPSGRLNDTIAFNLEDYPSDSNYGDRIENFYAEDIYNGYRYFETVNPEAAMYPFGSGIGYTSFEIENNRFEATEDEIRLFVTVTNTGNCKGREVVQVYYNPAQGVMGKPVRNLIRFAKTRELNPGESEKIGFSFQVNEMASYDDNGLAGHKSCWIVEAGNYEIYVGKNVRDAYFAGIAEVPECYEVARLSEACAPVKSLSRMRFDGRNMGFEIVLNRQTNLKRRIEKNRPYSKPYTGDKGYKLKDVVSQEVSLGDFLAQLSDEDLIHMTRMEGMCSTKVTGGTAGAFGGVTDRLKEFGIPIACCADGPSGIRRDDGSMAFSIPCGTLLACTWNTKLVEELFEYLGGEMRINKVDTILGPGMNIHRHPLNGRNFEYFSEDPYMTGEMAVAELKGLHKMGVTGTLKHFAANNQEAYRSETDSVLSERALREIYLKGFEKAVKQAGAYSIMSTYGALNGVWTAGNYDLLTTILRGEWDYKGIVMTDWWAKATDELELDSVPGIAPVSEDKYESGATLRAQNDLYAVVMDASNDEADNKLSYLKTGRITRGELLRSAENICSFLMRSPCMQDITDGETVEWEELDRPEIEMGQVCLMPDVHIHGKTTLPIENIVTEAGTTVAYQLRFEKRGSYILRMKLKSDLGAISQINGNVTMNKTVIAALSINGTEGEYIFKDVQMEVMHSLDDHLGIYFSQSGLQVGGLEIFEVE